MRTRRTVQYACMWTRATADSLYVMHVARYVLTESSVNNWQWASGSGSGTATATGMAARAGAAADLITAAAAVYTAVT